MNNRRYWIDKDSDLWMREWSKDEYATLDLSEHIFEKYWSFRCPICQFTPVPTSQSRAERRAKIHEQKTGHKCIVEYRDHELVCLDVIGAFSERLGAQVMKFRVHK